MMPDLPNVGLERDIDQFIVSRVNSYSICSTCSTCTTCTTCTCSTCTTCSTHSTCTYGVLHVVYLYLPIHLRIPV